jgi:hypothetical protein
MAKKVVRSAVKLLGHGELEISTRYAGDERSDPLPPHPCAPKKRGRGGREFPYCKTVLNLIGKEAEHASQSRWAAGNGRFGPFCLERKQKAAVLILCSDFLAI